MFKYSFCNLVWFKEDLAKSAERLARYGYDAIELAGEPDVYDPKEVKRILADSDLEVSNIVAIYSDERDLAHPNSKVRSNALEYVKKTVDWSAEIEAKTIGIAPTACMKTSPLASKDDEIKWAVENIQNAAEYAKSYNLKFVLEAWNRYEHYWLNRLEQCLELKRMVDRDNVGVMGDTFHMNIEEENLASSIKQAGSDLFHIHLADSNRAAPGKGNINFEPVIQALKEINYQGYISYEILPAAADPFSVIEKGVGSEFFDPYAEQSIRYIKDIENSLK